MEHSTHSNVIKNKEEVKMSASSVPRDGEERGCVNKSKTGQKKGTKNGMNKNR